MIPKKIHYCWFGKGEMGSLAISCIESWKEKLPNYDIVLWNENNFDVHVSQYSSEAYNMKKYAHVSDYARFWILEKYGGIYMDVDYEVLRPFDDTILENDVVLALDEGGDLTAFMASKSHVDFLKKMIERYNTLCFINEDGTYNDETMNVWMQDVLKNYGYIKENKNQILKTGIKVFKDDYFQAKSLLSGKFNITENTYTIHHHTLLWVSKKTLLIKFLRTKMLVPLLGTKRYQKLTNLLKKS